MNRSVATTEFQPCLSSSRRTRERSRAFYPRLGPGLGFKETPRSMLEIPPLVPFPILLIQDGQARLMSVVNVA
jgi:hypothetical protein